MKFLEANQIVSSFLGGEPLRFLLAMSGISTPLELYLRAAAAQMGRAAEVRTLPFGTLGQWIMQPHNSFEPEVFLLYPWDLVPEADWRSGLPNRTSAPDAMRREAAGVVDRLKSRGAHLLYVPAPMPPLLLNAAENAALSAWLVSLVLSAGAEQMPGSCFSLSAYLASGSPIASSSLGMVAQAIIAKAVAAKGANATEARKVLVTDLDNSLWAGVVAEEGPEGICYLPEGTGYPHFVYQTLLAKLRREGTLLAAVSRNDFGTAITPLRSGRMPLREGDFVSISCTYNAKSAQIQGLAQDLNLGLDAIVFVDDNPVELAEVSAALPQVQCIQFPCNAEKLPEILEEIARCFNRTSVTEEDLHRTEFYRLRIAAEGVRAAREDGEGGDLTEFLRSLQMKLVIHDRTHGERTRAVQLINKTNQFNLNGVRMSDDEIRKVLDAGGHLYGASLTDRNGSHGEILACLVASEGTILSLVLSCRVFQRRVEHAFLAWLAVQVPPEVRMRFQSTERNEPIRIFLEDPAFTKGPDGEILFRPANFARTHKCDRELFEVTTEASTPK